MPGPPHYDYAGDFETHLTIAAPQASVLRSFQVWCANRGYKCVQIVLDCGLFADQPMATWRLPATTATAAIEQAQAVAQKLSSEFEVTRIKVEAAPTNADVPLTDEDAARHDHQHYFEHHVKLLRDPEVAEDALSMEMAAWDARLSKNAFCIREDGREERFVTLRSYRAGRETSAGQLLRVLDKLADLSEHVLEFESEYCVFDSNVALDKGWMREAP